MSGFTKLVPEIIDSSIWNESSDVRIVWITLLATKNEDGYVRGDATTLQRKANVPIEAVHQALERFQSPDPSSHTPDNEGRRIAPAPGGWIVLNHAMYRAKDRKEYMRKYMKGYRAKPAVNSVNVNMANRSVSVSVSDSSSESSLEGGCKGEGLQPQKPDPFDVFWKVYPRKTGKKAAARAWKSAKDKPDLPTILAAVKAQAASDQWTKDGGQFIPMPATWLNQGRWADEAAQPAKPAAAGPAVTLRTPTDIRLAIEAKEAARGVLSSDANRPGHVQHADFARLSAEIRELRKRMAGAM